MADYRSVNEERLLETVRRLEQRIAAIFPVSGLRQVALELVEVARTGKETAKLIGQPYYAVRGLIALVLVSLFGVITLEIFVVDKIGQVGSVAEFIQVLEPTLGAIFFLAAIVAFLLSLETRWKRKRALESIHELRAMAHVVDMHQLTKDPTDEHLGESRIGDDARPLTPDELVRYLDFCSEMLSLISKVAVLYVLRFPYYVAVIALDEVESLTTGLSRKIW
ncbi:MAG: hypothetical protein AAF743_12810, partial [Planctomycetota bacterium]